MKKRHTLAATLLVVGMSVTGAWAEPTLEVTATEAEVVAQGTPAPAEAPAPVEETPAQQADRALAEGRELYRKGFTESAIVQYRKAIELNPDLTDAYIEFAKILVETKNQAYAITIYQKLEQMQPNEIQWKQRLFDLHSAYDMPREAARVGEDIAAARPDDVEHLRALAKVYKDAGDQGRHADTLLRAARVSNDARSWYDAGEAELAADHKEHALTAYQKAAELEPTNIEYQNGVGKALNANGDTEGARKHYEEMVKKFPEAQGLKDRQAETELALGDRMLAKRRFVAARKAYERAKDLGGNASAEGGQGATIQERIDKARRLNHVYIDNPFQVGTQGQNDFADVQTYIGVPMEDADVSFQLINDFRTASAPGRGSSSIDSVRAGVDWKFGENSNLYANAGGFGIVTVGVNHQDERFSVNAQLRRDIVSYTPDAIRTRLDYWGANAQVGYQINDWFSLQGGGSVYRYGDDITETTYNIGPRFTPINRPNDFVWAIGYNHGGVFNDRLANPLLRFGPTNFQVDTFGTDIEHWISKDFRYRLGYYRSISNVAGGDGNTFLAGFDWQVGEGSYLWLNYEYGNFVGGRVQPGLFSNDTSNYVLSGGFHVTF